MALGEEREGKFVKGGWARKAPRAESRRGWSRVPNVLREVSVSFGLGWLSKPRKKRAQWAALSGESFTGAAGVPARSEDAGWEPEGDADQP